LLLAVENNIPMQHIALVESMLFEYGYAKPYRTYKGDDEDMLSVSSANFYENVTTEEVKEFRKKTTLK
jgi:hypothetical protein